ncbi:hypothetical protein JCM16303_007162 [Sporobolomyces ruberrimus]
MVAQWLTIVGGICMALFPPLAYSDQYISICRKRNASGFSTDIPGLLIVSNVTRCIYWLGAKFQIYLLVQSILMIATQFGILYVCLLYKDPSEVNRRKKRPGNLWQWDNFPPYLEFTALLILLHCVMFLFLHRVKFYVELLGFVALGLEATLPIPQLLVNYENKSTAGFRHTVLAGWFLGDSFKTIYYFATGDNGIAFKACAVFQLSVDCMLLVQTFMYRKQTRLDLELRSRQFSQDHHHENDEEGHLDNEGVGINAGVAGPESLLHPKRAAKSIRNGSLRGGTANGGRIGESSETVFDLGEDGDENEESEEEEGNDIGREREREGKARSFTSKSGASR